MSLSHTYIYTHTYTHIHIHILERVTAIPQSWDPYSWMPKCSPFSLHHPHHPRSNIKSRCRSWNIYVNDRQKQAETTANLGWFHAAFPQPAQRDTADNRDIGFDRSCGSDNTHGSITLVRRNGFPCIERLLTRSFFAPNLTFVKQKNALRCIRRKEEEEDLVKFNGVRHQWICNLH